MHVLRFLWVMLLLAPHAHATEAPPVYEMALPANVVFVAFLAKGGDLFDLDLRAEVVLPLTCGDKVAGLLRLDGPRLDGADAYNVVLERHPVEKCKKDATRIGARWAIRMRIPDGQTRELLIGPRALAIARKKDVITLDGTEPMGDLPGAPATADPATLVLGDVTTAKLISVENVAPGDFAVAIEVSARWPKCAGAPLGMLASGDAASKFALDRFTPLARAPLDGTCAKATTERKATVRATLRLPKSGAAKIKVGAQELSVAAPAPAK